MLQIHIIDHPISRLCRGKMRSQENGEHFVCGLYGCETWSLTLREEHRLRVFEKKVLKRVFEPRRDEVTGEWRKFCLWSVWV
jgi:hypothetical protein